MPQIRIVPGGPMLVQGLPLGRLEHEGDAWRVEPVDTASLDHAICRCGASAAMPLCDREAPYGCFEEEPATGPEPGPFTWTVPDPSIPGVAIKPNGPVRVAGGVAITYGADAVPGRDRISLCRCGASRCQPVCDSTHKVVGYRG
jgi:CDGSH-type Zn-finger protein